MSVLFLPSPSAASIPDATETSSGKIRIATSAEATAGTNDVTAMTPAKVKTVVDAALVGGVQYQGTFDASSPADLSNAEKGDLYIISVAGSYQGKDWAIGDHLLINADMGGTLDPNKIDKVDNTDAVTSVAGRTGAITLSTADISGLATVASTGAYSDLTGTPTLATVATTGAYSDLTGSPTNVSSFTNDAGYLTDITGENLGDLADVTISTPSNGQGLVYSSGTWVNGSPSVGNLDDIGDVDTTGVADTNVLKYDSATSTWVDGVVNYSEVSGTPTLATVATTGAYSDLTGSPTNVSSFTNDAGYLTDITGENLDDLADVTISTPSNGQGLVYSSGTWVNGSPAVANLNDIGDVSAPSPQNGEILKYVSSTGSWTESPLINYVYAGSTQTQDLPIGFTRVNITGSTTTVLTLNISTATGASGAVFSVLSQGTASYNTLTIGSQSWNFKPNQGGVFQAQGTNTAYLVSTVDYDNLANLPTLGTAAALDVGTSANNVVQLDGTAKLPAVDGSQLTNISASVANLDDIGDVNTTGVVDTNVLKYDSATSTWVDGVVNYSEVSGTPTLATVATTGAYSDLTGAPTLATVATTGAYSDLTGSPTNVSSFTNDAGYLTNITGENINDLADVNIVSLQNGQSLAYNSATGKWENLDIPVSLNDVGDVSVPAPSNTNVLKYNSTSGNWESAVVAASEVTGLATVATTGAYSDLSGAPTLATVATTGAYSDLTGSPTNVSSFTNDAGYLTDITGESLGDLSDVDLTTTTPTTGDYLTYNGTNWLPAAITVNPATVTSASPASTYTVTISAYEQIYLLSPSVACAVTLPAPTSYVGTRVHLKMITAQSLSISVSGGSTIDGQSSISVSAQYTSLGFISDGTNWHIF